MTDAERAELERLAALYVEAFRAACARRGVDCGEVTYELQAAPPHQPPGAPSLHPIVRSAGPKPAGVALHSDCLALAGRGEYRYEGRVFDMAGLAQLHVDRAIGYGHVDATDTSSPDTRRAAEYMAEVRRSATVDCPVCDRTGSRFYAERGVKGVCDRCGGTTFVRASSIAAEGSSEASRPRDEGTSSQ